MDIGIRFPSGRTSSGSVLVSGGLWPVNARFDLYSSPGVPSNCRGASYFTLRWKMATEDLAGALSPLAPETVLEEAPPSVTRSTSATFRFTSSQPVSTYECRLDSTPLWEPCASPKAYSGLLDGTHLFEVRAKNIAGLADPSPALWNWRVDTIPPDTQITSGPSEFSNSPTAEFTFSANEQDVTFECQLDAGSWEPCVSPKRYVELAEGSHDFQVRATDAAGNVEPAPASRSWTVDLTLPETTLTAGPSGFVASGSATFEFASSELGMFECRLDAGQWGSCASPKIYAGLSDGNHIFEVRAIDRAGNVDPSPASQAWTVDATPPETTIVSGPQGETEATSATFEFTSSEAGSSFACRLDGGGWTNCVSPVSYGGLGQGGHSFDVRATDQVGNVDSSPARRDWIIANKPSLALSGSLKQAADAGGVLVESDYDLFVSADDPYSGVTSIEISVDGVVQDFLSRGCPGGGCRLERWWAFPNGDFNGGQHVLQVTARNGAGYARSENLSITTNPPDRDENGPEGSGGGGGGGGGGPEETAADDALEPEARTRWPDTFAGLWQVAEGTVFIAFTQNSNENVDALRRDYPSAPELVPVTLPRSLTELEALQERMIADRELPPADGLFPLPERYDLGIDVTQNSVYAVVEELDPNAQLAFTTRYGNVLVRQGPLAEPEQGGACTRADCRYALRAGLIFGQAPGVKDCSSAFVARPNGGGNPELLSAGHCPGQDRFHAEERYGTVLDQQVGHGRIDAERHSINAPFSGEPVMLVDGTESARPVQSVSRWDETRVGRRVCKTGFRSGRSCGEITDKHFSPSWLNDAHRFVRAKYCARPGDSGGAVFKARTAFGIHSGGSKGSCRQAGDFSAFSHVQYVENAFNVSVMTAP